MYDYSQQIDAFHSDRVVLPKKLSANLTAHRTANEDRLIKRLPELKDGIRVGRSSFRSQGSFAMKTIIQTKFADEEYDIDDGLVLWRSDLEDQNGADMTPAEAKGIVCKALKDSRFNRQPQTRTNCVRVFYAEEDDEKHHVDFPVYRKWAEQEGEDVTTYRQLAGQSEWVDSDPTRVNVWFEEQVRALNSASDGAGTQLRRCLRLLKRFCRSRLSWDMPNGMKLTMLTVECFASRERIDIAFRDLLEGLFERLGSNLVVENLADNACPRAKLTRTATDSNMVDLRDRVGEALGKLEVLDDDGCDRSGARTAWDWVFKTDGFFLGFDDDGDDARDDNGGKSDAVDKGIAISTPTRPVNPEGGGRYG
ncbi:MAG: hypothetical protein GY906_34215 [bacterium]|nr:hypothetical protein [bacterium]